jgi:hypothetical protein
MQSSLPVNEDRARGPKARTAACGLALAASPTFALMAWVTARQAPMMPLCAPGMGILPVDGMTTMYLLMSLFHLSPWLKLASRRPHNAGLALTQGD